MEKIDIVLMWHGLNGRSDKIENRIEKLDEKMTDIERRLCRLEGAFASKDCCMIKDERHIHKAKAE